MKIEAKGNLDRIVLAVWSVKHRSKRCGKPVFCRFTALRQESFVEMLLALTKEQWVEADFQVPESFSQVSLQMTVRARCVPFSSAS
jgi:hypothetical protein